MGGGNLFTGIVEEIGKIAGIQKGAKSAVLTIQADKVLEDVHIGDSIAVNGVCLTVTSFEKNTYTADVMNETLQRSSLGSLSVGSIDGNGTITQVKRDDNAIWYTIMAEASLMKYIVEKGSIAIDGISLTVAKRSDKDFSISMIPHTAKETILSQKKAGDVVNLENDIIGKYVEQLLQYDKKEEKQSRLTKEFLLQAGF